MALAAGEQLSGGKVVDADGHEVVTIGGGTIPVGSLPASVALVSQPQTFQHPQHVITSDAGVVFDTGPGGGYGAPSTAPTVATGAAGGLTGAYQYVYTETDPYGETTISPASSVVNPATQKVTITLPLPRKGISQRRLYRTKAGVAGTYYFLSALTSGGTGYFQTIFTDNVADGALGANPPVADTTSATNLVTTQNSVTYIRNTPGSGDISDLTILTGNPLNAGSYSIDSYGPIVSRNKLGHSFHSEITDTGNGAHHLDCATISATNPDVSAAPVLATVLYVADVGNIVSTPSTDVNVIQVTQVASATLNVLIAKQSGDTQNRFSIGPSGALTWGSGSAIPDVNISRTAANLLATNQGYSIGTNAWVGNFLAVGGGVAAGTTPSNTVDVAVTSTNNAILALRTASWGSLQIKAAGTSPGDCTIGSTNGVPLRLGANGPVMALAIDTSQNVIAGPGAKASATELATNATNGFFYIPTMNGSPSGTPAALPTGAAPMVVDRTGNKLWLYVGGAWKGVAIA